jgi:IS30 family transposase
MSYKHFHQNERYQIHSLIKANQSITLIAEQRVCHKPTVSRELARNEGSSGYWPYPACELVLVRSQCSRNTHEVKLWVMCQEDCCLVCNGVLSRSRASSL